MNSAAKRVLIFGINYAPEVTGIAPYTTELSRHFAEQGHLVRVITGMPHYPDWKRLPLGKSTTDPRLTVERHAHFIPTRPNALGRMLYELTWLVSASRAHLEWPCDLAIGIVPSLSGGFLATAAGRRWRAPVGIVIKDLMGPAAAQSGYTGGSTVAGITTRLETRVLRGADQVAIIADGFANYLERIGVPKSRIQRVRDWTHPGEPSESEAECRRRLGWGVEEFICLHSGNMGQKQGLVTLLEAAQLLTEDSIRIVLAGAGNDEARLRRMARDLALKNVSFLELQPAGRFEAMLRSADVLLVNQRASVGDMSLPSKLSAYFAAGRAVIASVAPDCETAREVKAANGGIVVPAGQPAALAEAIRTLRGAPAMACLYGRNARSYARRNLTPQAALAGYDDFLGHLLTESRYVGRMTKATSSGQMSGESH